MASSKSVEDKNMKANRKAALKDDGEKRKLNLVPETFLITPILANGFFFVTVTIETNISFSPRAPDYVVCVS